MYGRRRVGKTFLVNHFFDKRFDFKLTGDFKGDKQVQLSNFYSELKNHSGKDIDFPKNWREAFWQLREYIEALSEKRQGLTRSEIALKTKLADNDKLTKAL